jgi:hypothetical protein
LRRAAVEVLAMEPAAYAALARACLERARHYHPLRISRILGTLYDEVLGAG